MPQVQSIKRLHREGYTVSEIAESTKLSRPTVRKYIAMDDFNQPVPQENRRPSKLDPYKDLVISWLEEDRKAWHKQHHTAKRIYDRLLVEGGYTGICRPGGHMEGGAVTCTAWGHLSSTTVAIHLAPPTLTSCMDARCPSPKRPKNPSGSRLA